MAARYRETHIQSNKSNSAWLLYLYSLPYLFSILSKLINGELINLVLTSAVFVAIVVAATWMSTGLKNRSLYLSQKFANSKPFPMMFLSSLVLGAASFVASWLLAEFNLFAAIGFGAAATVGCWLWYGLDPIKSKHIGFNDINDAEKALEILQESEALVLSIEKSAKNIKNREMNFSLEKITALARDVLNVLYENPGKITKARRFLNTYLTGAESVVERYSSANKDDSYKKLDENFKEVLGNIENVFAEQYEKLISSDVFDLDVDIEVLNTLLKKQGIN
ncbi:MAG TPA: 5-bromo-4-chloroindolyl phosphate hydrolysis family protein [Gammaproteobacteria bacterium]|nr:5-bromo-4-chloroindolyl phosphate hydrolysis family protein [Gammaproteobacteria bacterium]